MSKNPQKRNKDSKEAAEDSMNNQQIDNEDNANRICGSYRHVSRSNGNRYPSPATVI
jgi:hypothetical protein